MREKMILTAGPSITQKEVDYVCDAVTNGWNEHWGDYIKRFENAFADYVGVKHALSTSSCTGALHLALAALGIGNGDEVIVPDLTWVATASVVTYVGATPVFADVLPDSWCIDPASVEQRITPRTKAIIPVHLYGQPADMKAIMELAQRYQLRVIEDAAPSIGALFDGKRTGSFGDFAGFSFQGAKLMVTGEGGMLVTNDSQLFEMAKHYAEHGRSATGFHISDIGYKYKMSNIQAALGLGQLERVDELIARKAQLFQWYKEGLQNLSQLTMNKECTSLEKPIYWMTSIVLNNDYSINRDELMSRLEQKGIASRPFFPQVSTFRMFRKTDNPVSGYLAENGINLPSGHNLTKSEIDYICECISDILSNG